MVWISTRTGKAKAAISWFFFVTGATLGNWATLLPFVKEEQNISNGELGLILLAAVGGALIALPIITYCNNRYGTGWSTMGSGIILVLFLPLVGIVYNVGVFTLGVFMLGFVIGCLDVSVNGQAVTCEKMTRTPTIGLFHCIYSFGAFVGAIIGGLLMEQNESSVLKEVVIFGLILLLPGVLLSSWLYSFQEEKLLTELYDRHHDKLLNTGVEEEHPNAVDASRQTDRAGEDVSMHSGLLYNCDTAEPNPEDSAGSSNLLSSPCASGVKNTEWQENGDEQGLAESSPVADGRGKPLARLLRYSGCASWVKYIPMAQIAFLALLACFAEGSVNDWSVIYFTDSLDASPLVSALAFAGFELSIACGRYFSDYAVLQLGRRKLMVVSGIVAVLGMGLVVLAPSLVDVQRHKAALQGLSIVGFSVCGLGLSSLAPSAISLAGSAAISRAAGVTSADSIATVTSVSYLGIMFSPPFLGGLSVALHSLRWSFAVSAAMLTPIAVTALCIDQVVFDTYDQGMRQSSDLDVADGDRETAAEEHPLLYAPP
jgi:MFS family permease